MIVALAMRSRSGLSVLHDRAPLFVRLAMADLRNGYTVKIVNKTQAPVVFELRIDGLDGATLVGSRRGLGAGGRRWG